jgi:uncharacterized protein YbjT (DUF2867 family)
MAKKAIIVGASGLIGSKLLPILLQREEYDSVLLLVRKKLQINHEKLTQQLVDFDSLTQYTDLLTGHALFCCLGSTKRKTPNLSDYRKVDHDYPLELAKIAGKNGIAQYHLVSSIGASAASSNFYTKMKGETEDDIIKAGLNCLHIYRPSMLSGKRNETRLMEVLINGLMKVINPLLIGGLKKYRSIPAQTVAIAMFKQSLINKTGVFIHPSDKIKQLS